MESDIDRVGWGLTQALHFLRSFPCACGDGNTGACDACRCVQWLEESLRSLSSIEHRLRTAYSSGRAAEMEERDKAWKLLLHKALGYSRSEWIASEIGGAAAAIKADQTTRYLRGPRLADMSNLYQDGGC